MRDIQEMKMSFPRLPKIKDIRFFKQGRGKRGIKVTGALRSAGFQKIPARPQIVFNRFTGLNMLV